MDKMIMLFMPSLIFSEITNVFLVITYLISIHFITNGYEIIYESLAAFDFFPIFHY